MKNKKMIVYGGLAIGLIVTGFIVYKTLSKPKVATTLPVEEVPQEIIPTINEAQIQVTLTKSSGKANTVDLGIQGLDSKYTGVGYEFTYESKQIIKGVNSGNTPVDVTGKNDYTKEVYLGTCSRNVCTPDPGVTKITVALEFTDASGKKSQFTKDFDL
jgi:hypothetical protein